MALFYGWGSTASRLEPLQGDSLLFTTKFPDIPGTHFIDLGRMKGWVDLGPNQRLNHEANALFTAPLFRNLKNLCSRQWLSPVTTSSYEVLLHPVQATALFLNIVDNKRVKKLTCLLLSFPNNLRKTRFRCAFAFQHVMDQLGKKLCPFSFTLKMLL